MKIKTADLIGPALDWAVAEAQGRKEIRVFGRTRPSDRGWIEVRFNPDPRVTTARFDPSENWSQGGPIIDREKISVRHIGHSIDGELWDASINDEEIEGPTALIAAMRCLVAAYFGDEVEIPDELI